MFSSIVRSLGTCFPVRSGVHSSAFSVGDVEVEIINCSNGGVSVLVAPGAPFESHLLSYGNGRWRLRFQDEMPATMAVSGFGHGGGLLFAGIEDSKEACLLLRTLFRIIDYDRSLCAFVRSLYDECLASSIWTARSYGGDSMRLTHELGEIRVARAGDQICIYAQPLDAVYERFMVWTGCFEGLRNGVLVHGATQFVGGQEEFGSMLSFAFRFPDDEDETRSLLRLLVSIFEEHVQFL
jgi:hypothetical protein